MVRILGLDPGLRLTGWGIIQSKGSSLEYIAHGVVPSTEKAPMAERLLQIYDGLKEVLEKFSPHEAAVEETFVNKNASSTLKLGLARGVVLLTPAVYKIPVSEYGANQVKKAVVGVGHASKDQVAAMVQRFLPRAGAVTLDAADALAVAICHAHFRSTHAVWLKDVVSSRKIRS